MNKKIITFLVMGNVGVDRIFIFKADQKVELDSSLWVLFQESEQADEWDYFPDFLQDLFGRDKISDDLQDDIVYADA